MAIVFSPAGPAAWLAFGMLFGLAAAHFLAVPWSKPATALLYALPAMWLVLITLFRPVRPSGLAPIDILFALFVLAAVTSLTFVGGETDTRNYFLFYIPFMVIVPYVCGRLMHLSDRNLFFRTIQIAGAAMLPLLLLDRFTSQGGETGRWAFFGQDHGALLAGALLAASLIALCVRALKCETTTGKNQRRNRIALYGLIGIITASLVWVSARGWLLAGLVGVVVACVMASNRRYKGLLALVFATIVLSIGIMPRIDPIASRMYAIPLELPIYEDTGGGASSRSVLGDASCEPFHKGVDSVAMRLVLYREALAMFGESPVFGVGAARFGAQSCVGHNGFPHSTVLQGFAELGLLGGALLIGLVALATTTLVRRVRSNRDDLNQRTYLFALALLSALFVADQIYGNYFMSVGMWLMLGIAAGLDKKDEHGNNRNA